MLAAAKSAAPQAAFGALHRPVLDFAAQGATTLFTAPPGYLLTDSLASVLAEHNCPVLWLRLGPEDRDPATFLLSLIISARKLNPNVGTVTLEEMQRNPGPVVGWPRLYERLAYELADSLPPSTAIVLEHFHHLESAQPILGLIGNHLLPRLPPNFSRILISHHSLAPGFLPNKVSTPGTGELRMNARAGVSLSNRIGTGLAENCIRRILSMTDGRAVALVGVLSACQTLGPAFIHQVVTHSKNSQDLLSRIAKGSLAAADAESLQALSLAAELGYCHPAVSKAILGSEPFLSGPWIQNLASGWLRIRSLWQNPLTMALRSPRGLNETILCRVADFLAEQGEREDAIQMYFLLGDTHSAVRNIADAAGQWMNLGQWETLERWLQAVPQKALHEWPRLVYLCGEIAAVRGDVEQAFKHFLKAAGLFSLGSEREGACQSLLAASTLADWKNDLERSWNYASAACSLAEAAGLEWQHGWATWQLGRLALASGRLDEALVHFHRATAAIQEPDLEALFREVENLAMRQVELQKQGEFHRQSALKIEQEEKETAHRLQSLLLPPPQNLAGMLAQRGWAEIPLMLKLPAPPGMLELSAGAGQPGLLKNFQRWLLQLRTHSQPEMEPSSPPVFWLPAPLPSERIILPAPPTADIAPAGENVLPSGHVGDQPAESRPAESEPVEPAMTVHMFGEFRISVNRRAIEKWQSGKGVAVLKYMLAHSEGNISRDVLMDTFWPDASPESARNSLNVALHGLRQTFRSVSEIPVVLFEAGNYRLNPQMDVWTDVGTFEQHLKTGQYFEAHNQVGAAVSDYEIAMSLYRGDFLTEDPYEQWTILPRERLRINYMDMLDRLAGIYFTEGRYAACIVLCQCILERDNCREDAHRRLMQCYVQQGQPHLALRQYQVCEQALRAELEVEPEPATAQLAERIRRREQV